MHVKVIDRMTGKKNVMYRDSGYRFGKINTIIKTNPTTNK